MFFMQVLCISKVINPNPRLLAKGMFPKIVEGEIYTVNGEGHNSYELTFDIGHWYNKKFFIPISDIDETEIYKNRLSQLS